MCPVPKIIRLTISPVLHHVHGQCRINILVSTHIPMWDEESNKHIVSCIGPLQHVTTCKIYISDGPPLYQNSNSWQQAMFTDNYDSDCVVETKKIA